MIGPNTDNRPCYLCGSILRGLGTSDDRGAAEFECLCGRYSIGYDVEELFRGVSWGARAPLTAEERMRLAWFVTEACENGKRSVEISGGNLDDLLSIAPQRGDLLDSIDFALGRIGRLARQISFDQVVSFGEDQFALYRTQSAAELGSLRHSMTDLGYVKREAGGVKLTPKGWERVRELRRVSAKPDQAFVAMWFDPSLLEAWNGGFHQALYCCGYDPVRIDKKHFEGKVDDEILASIRRSGLVVADFTGTRGGVYFEAGFAMGLGIPVVWTCSASHFKDVHFDTNHYPFVVWDDVEDLKQQLTARVDALYPRVRRSLAIAQPAEP